MRNLFVGRLSRKHFAIGFLSMLVSVGVIISVVLASIPRPIDLQGFTVFLIIFIIAIWLFGVSLFARRFHDLNKSGWWGLLYLIPSINLIALFFLLFSPSKNDNNRFGQLPSGDTPLLKIIFGLAKN
ncbi:MAG: hypothetical protein UX39_C0005G0018 [Candidatus Magasanikbacteria bacterium GW2011_GWA2_46_17]|uniref:DUF805 domain-containing protein n=1 Tax=Candidatus Magasanikbacteria bacterium GW2011_GWA2_46_17 TaxID=1619042 RepID=A0A0G1S189_9BACT|nr:MAG: hypothetical protein UX39_C0005G0018 [Candidatus Magasanikbacteria bacterium GW2011_GWA2_46_17]